MNKKTNKIRFKLKTIWLINEKLSNSKKGFSLLEVLITILAISFFLLGSLQATILATFLRIQGQDQTEGLNWIKKDLELIRYEAFNLDKDLNNKDGDLYTKYVTQLDPPNTSNCDSYGDTLITKVNTNHPGGANPFGEKITINNKDYGVYREYTTNGNALRINYALVYDVSHPRYNSNDPYKYPDSDNANIVATISTEVIPNAALNCP